MTLDSLVMEVQPESDRLDKYRFYGVEVVRMETRSMSATVTLKSKKRSSTLGVSMNPGPAAGARPIAASGVNTGWVHRHKAKTGEKGIALELLDFSVDKNHGLLSLTFMHDVESLAAVKELLRRQGTGKEIILVLPLKTTGGYTEYKFWNPVALNMPTAKVLVGLFSFRTT